jgi:Putative zinc-finger
VSEIVSQAQDRRLGWLERWRMRIHLRVCEGCREFQGQMSFLRRAIRRDPRLRDDDK